MTKINALILLISNIIFDAVSLAYSNGIDINEMARVKVSNRTINRNLWLSVASTCSRNKSTEAEFIKPLGNDKDILLQKYVAALLIMKKPCPKNENDIDSIKTFKLIGHLLVKLGVSFELIQTLYNQNNGVDNTLNSNVVHNSTEVDSLSNSIDNSVSEPTDNEGSIVGNIDSDDISFDDEPHEKRSGSLFADDYDDLFGNEPDIIDELSADAYDMDKDVSILDVCSKVLGVSKPRGFKYVKHTEKEYDKLVYAIDEYPWYMNWRSYLKKVQDILEQHNWKLYECFNMLLRAGSHTIRMRFEGLTDTEIKDLIKWSKQRYVYIHEPIDHYFQLIKDYKKNRKSYISTIDNIFVKLLFEQDENVYGVYISPDKGMYMLIRRDTPLHLSCKEDRIFKNPSKKYYNNFNCFTYTISFTGKYNYKNKLLVYTDKEEIETINKNNKLLNKFGTFFKNAIDMLSRINDYKCQFDNNMVPYALKAYQQNVLQSWIDSWLRRRNVYSTTVTVVRKIRTLIKTCPMYKVNTNPKYNDSNAESVYIQNDEYFGYSYVAIQVFKDKAHKYSYDDYYCKFILTDEGIEDFKNFLNNKGTIVTKMKSKKKK